MNWASINRQKSKAHLQDFIWACVFMGILATGYFLVSERAIYKLQEHQHDHQESNQ